MPVGAARASIFMLMPVFTAEEAKALNDRVLRDVPMEKAMGVVRQAQIARVLEKTGSIRRDGLGQRTGVVDARTFFRFQQEFPGCWNDKGFRDEFLRDNPQCRAEGYKVRGRPKYISASTA